MVKILDEAEGASISAFRTGLLQEYPLALESMDKLSYCYRRVAALSHFFSLFGYASLALSSAYISSVDVLGVVEDDCGVRSPKAFWWVLGLELFVGLAC